MAEKGKGFVLAPSRFGVAPTAESNTTVPKFTGLKKSKLGVLADAKLPTPATVPLSDEKTEKDPTVKNKAFSFTPLSKPPELSKENTETTATPTSDDKPDDKSLPVFGENLSSKVIFGGSTVSTVFGQNLSEKAIVPKEKEKEEEDSGDRKETSELKFSSVLPTQKTEEVEQKTLSESAAEYTETHSNKRKYEEVAVITGEEEESNVMQANVKLYLFDSVHKNWTERSRGQIRLNDAPLSTPGHIRSRLVMRTHGSLRVVLNTKLWPQMVCEKVNDENIRISAWDDDVVRIFLVRASAKDADKLYSALECRITQLKQDNQEEGEPSSKKPLVESQ